MNEKRKQKNKDKWLNERFITCKYCGYNNFKNRLESFGTCLRCGKIIDEKSYFKKKLGGKDLWLEKTKLRMKTQTKIYEKYQEMMKKAKKYYIEGAVIDGLRYECMAEAYFEGAADMLKELDPKKSISKDAWKISV